MERMFPNVHCGARGCLFFLQQVSNLAQPNKTVHLSAHLATFSPCTFSNVQMWPRFWLVHPGRGMVGPSCSNTVRTSLSYSKAFLPSVLISIFRLFILPTSSFLCIISFLQFTCTGVWLVSRVVVHEFHVSCSHTKSYLLLSHCESNEKFET